MEFNTKEKIIIYDLIGLELRFWESLSEKTEFDLNYINELKSLKEKLRKDLYSNLVGNNQPC